MFFFLGGQIKVNQMFQIVILHKSIRLLHITHNNNNNNNITQASLRFL